MVHVLDPTAALSMHLAVATVRSDEKEKPLTEARCWILWFITSFFLRTSLS